MRRIWVIFVFLILPVFVFGQNFPQPQGFVNDFAGVIVQEYKDKLNALVSQVEEKSSSEIAVVTIDSIAPYDEVEYARLLFDNWKPGKKGKDNGVLVLLAVKERRWRIETGYGIEGILPDGLCGEIGRNYMVPYFKEGKYAEGLYQGVLKISQILTKDVNAPENNSTLDSIVPLIVLLFILGFIVLSIYLSHIQRKNGRYRDGRRGYGGGWGNAGGSWGGRFGGGGGGGGGAGGKF